jgi:hypothetical protein
MQKDQVQDWLNLGASQYSQICLDISQENGARSWHIDAYLQSL